MPTVIPAAHVPHARPKTNRFKPLAFAVPVALILAASAVFAQPSSVAASARPNCSGWNSLTRPPSTIRVLRVHQNRIQVVDFKKYVITVMGKEWPSYLPQQVIEAGAVAVKQYAWHHSVYSSRSINGRCFDVKDGTDDQLYKPDRARVRVPHYKAVDATWHATLRKNGRFFMTGYRRGEPVGCGRDHTGYKLYARSAIRCARQGMNWRQILFKYYGPNLQLVENGNSSSAPAAGNQSAVRSPAPSTQTLRVDADWRNGRWVEQAPAQPEPTVASADGAAGGGLSGGVAVALRRETFGVH